MSNPDIERINKAKLENKQDAFDILVISASSATVSDVIKKFKQPARSIHPDKNRDEVDAATEACKKLLQAKEYALSNDENCNNISFNANFSWDEFKDDPYITGGIVLQARNILLAWAGIYRTIDQGTSPGTVREFFQNLSFGDDAIALKDKECLLKYANLLFPSGYVASYEIAGKFKASELHDQILFLQSLVSRYEVLGKNYNILFKEKIANFLIKEKKSLDNVIQAAGLAEEFDNKPPFKFNSFEEFSFAFTGSDPAFCSKAVYEYNSNLLDAFSILDEYTKEHSDFFSDLVHAANLLRKKIIQDELFLYSDTDLDENTEKAQKINNLCGKYSQLQVLNAQLCHIIRPILGDRFVEHLPKDLQSQFPKHDAVIISANTSRYDKEKKKHLYTIRH